MFTMCLKLRLINLTKLSKYNEVLKRYDETFCDYVENGIAVRAPKDEIVKHDNLH